MAFITICLLVASCEWSRGLDTPVEPELNAPVFCYSYDMMVNGEHVHDTVFFYYNPSGFWLAPDPGTYGQICASFRGWTKYKEQHYLFENIRLNVSFAGRLNDIYNEAGERIIRPFDIACDVSCDGMGPFKERFKYQFAANQAKLRFDYEYRTGFKADLLSGTYSLERDISNTPGVGERLHFYFDFEEVILSVNSESLQEGRSPFPGDTIRVTNGHFIQAYGLYNEEQPPLALVIDK